MAMLAATLAAGLLSLTVNPSDTELAARQKFADAYGSFASTANAGGAVITPVGVAAGKAAMVSALAGLSTPGSGATVLTNAVLAFWSAVAAGLATSFAGATAITPPPHAGLGSELQSVGNANVASKASAIDATNAIANAFYSQAIIGGTVTIGITPFPIL